MGKYNFDSYRSVNYHPLKRKNLDSVGSVLHSLCVTKGYTWKESYCKLINAAGKIGMMPQYRKTIREVLNSEGFFLQAGAYAGRTVQDIMTECNSRFHDGEVVILNLSDSVTYGNYVPLISSKVGYELHSPNDDRKRTAKEVWIAWKDGQDHSIMPRRKNTRQAAKQERHIQENEALVVQNENPNDNYIGDCAVRAFAAVLEIPWVEAVKKLVEAQNYTETFINLTSNIEVLLEKEGFQKFGPMKRDGRILTGKEFCYLIHDMFQAGTRIYAYPGNHHAVAVLVFDGEYKIVDTWDSTNHKIVKYWAKYPEHPQRRPKLETKAEPVKLTKLSLGTKINHKAYGIGEVVDLTSTIATIRFLNGTEKKLAIAWILTNCTAVQ